MYIYIYIYIRHRAARHARACSVHPSGGLILCLVCLFLRGPQPVTRITRQTRIPVFEHLFCFFFFMTFWSQMVIPREPKIAQNHKKSCSRGLPESTLKKDTKYNRKNDFSGRLAMQCAHACAVQTHFFVFTFQWPKAAKKEPKSFPKWSLWAPKSQKNQKNKYSKKH